MSRKVMKKGKSWNTESKKGFHEKENKPKIRQIDEKDGINDFVIGRIPVIEVLKGKRDVNKLFIQENLSGEKIALILRLAKEKGVHIQSVPKTKLDQLTDNKVHQGVVIAVSAYNYATLDDLFNRALYKKEEPFFIILDGIEDPHNLGSIMRTADAVGAHGIIIPKHRAVGLTSVVSKISTGAIEHIPVVKVTNLTQTIMKLKEKGVWIYATDMKGTPYTKWKNVTGALAVVIGNEGKGVSRLVKESSDELLTIPMIGHVQSLNASVAASLLLYEVFRGRHFSM